MGKVRSVEYDAGIKTKYIQESDGKLTTIKFSSHNFSLYFFW